MTVAEYVQGLREIADFYEQHQDVALPYEGTCCKFTIYGATKDQIAEGARAFGKADKHFDGDTFELIHTFPSGQSLGFYASRTTVCEPVVVGTKIEPAHVIPAKFEPEQQVPERVIEIVEWRCGSLLAPEPIPEPIVSEESDALSF